MKEKTSWFGLGFKLLFSVHQRDSKIDFLNSKQPNIRGECWSLEQRTIESSLYCCHHFAITLCQFDYRVGGSSYCSSGRLAFVTSSWK